MKILLDSRELSLDGVEDKTFACVLEEVTEFLEKDGRMLFDVYIDGEIMDNYEYFIKEQINIVEFISRSPKMIILESLNGVNDFISKYFDALMGISESFNNFRTNEGVELLFEVENGLEWIYSIIASLKENTAIDFKYENFDMMFLEYRTILTKLKDSIKSGDYIGGLAVLEIEMSSELIFLQENLDLYMKEVMIEEVNEHKYN